jgi:hypothetical protein
MPFASPSRYTQIDIKEQLQRIVDPMASTEIAVAAALTAPCTVPIYPRDYPKSSLPDYPKLPET